MKRSLPSTRSISIYKPDRKPGAIDQHATGKQGQIGLWLGLGFFAFGTFIFFDQYRWKQQRDLGLVNPYDYFYTESDATGVAPDTWTEQRNRRRQIRGLSDDHQTVIMPKSQVAERLPREELVRLQGSGKNDGAKRGEDEALTEMARALLAPPSPPIQSIVSPAERPQLTLPTASEAIAIDAPCAPAPEVASSPPSTNEEVADVAMAAADIASITTTGMQAEATTNESTEAQGFSASRLDEQAAAETAALPANESSLPEKEGEVENPRRLIDISDTTTAQILRAASAGGCDEPEPSALGDFAEIAPTEDTKP